MTDKWANLPRELSLKIFDLLSNNDERFLYQLAQVCRQWRDIICNSMIGDYDDFLNQIKISLKLYKLNSSNVVIKNLFTCFYLAEYDEDFLFWPNMSANNMNYCSEIKGRYQIVSYEITSKYIEYIKLTDSDYVEQPTDCYNDPYLQYTHVSPFSGTQTNQIEIIRLNVYPQFKKSLYTLCIYKIDPDVPKSSTFVYHSNPIQYHLNSNKKVTYATFSQNNEYFVAAFVGLIVVYRLPEPKKDGSSVNLNDLTPIFTKQQPSVVKFLTVDDNGQVLFIKSLRLGGLSMINMITGEELEFPHYRLELNMASHINDHFILLNGYEETIIYGLPKRRKLLNSAKPSEAVSTSVVEDDYISKIKKLKLLPDEIPLWDYFEYHINASQETVVPLNNVLPIDAPGCYIGLLKGHKFPSKHGYAFAGRDNERSIDLVLLIDRDYSKLSKDLKGKYLEDFYPHEEDGDEESDETEHDAGDAHDSDDLDDLDNSFDDELASQFKIVPLLFNIQYLSRSCLLSISGDGKRFAILINNLLYIVNVSAESVSLILDKYLKGQFDALDLLRHFNIYTDPTDFHLELASSLTTDANVLKAPLNHHVYFIDRLLELTEFKEQHKKFNNNNAAINSDDDDDDDDGILSDDLNTEIDTNILLRERTARLGTTSTEDGFTARARPLEYKPQLLWVGNDKICINFNGNLSTTLSLESLFE